MNVKTHPTLLSDMLVSNFGNIVNDIFNDERPSKVNNFRPRIELSDIDTAYQLKLMLPGVKKEDISIIQKDGVLKISGTRRNKETEFKALINEFVYGDFERLVRLPKNASTESIDAAYDNGILTVTIGKHLEIKPQEIKIK